MRQDEIIEVARQAGLTKTVDCCGVANKFCSQDQWKGSLSVFAKLVTAKERESCANLKKEISLDGAHSTEYEEGFWDALAIYSNWIKNQ